MRSIKDEALAQMVMLGERSLDYAIQQYLAHYHYERNHPGLDNHLIAREEAVSGQAGPVVRRERLGGLLSYSHLTGRVGVFSVTPGKARARSCPKPCT